MTVAALPSTVTYNEDGVTVAFPAPFRFKAPGDLIVERLFAADVVVTLVLNVDYTVTGGETDAGGTVTRTLAASGASLRIRRRTARQQPMVYSNGDRFPAESHEQALDRNMLISQEIDDATLELFDRAALTPLGGGADGLFPVVLPGNVFGFASGTGADAGLRADLASSTGLALIGMAQAGIDLPRASLEAVIRAIAVHVHLFRKTGEATDTAAVVRALATGRPIAYVAGQGSDADGAYLQGMVQVPAGAVICGDGVSSVIRDVGGPEGTNGTTDLFAMFDVTSSSNITTVDNILIFNLQMQGVVGDVGGHAARGFREHRHCINLRGVSGVTIKGVKFYGWRGDAICLSGDVVTPTLPVHFRHNYNVDIRHCHFDGHTGDNRQATSILDCLNFRFNWNRVENCTRSDMPGAVDFEPSPYTDYILGDLVVFGNNFKNVGGNLGVVTLQVPSVVTNLPVGLLIAFNHFSPGPNTGSDISLNMNRTFSNANRDQAIVITGNRGFGGSRPFNLFSVKGVRLDESNVWEGYSNGPIVGFTGTAAKPYGCVIKPTLKSCGFAGMQVYRGDYLTLGGDFVDTGTVALFFDGVAAAGDGTTHITIRDLKTKAGGTIAVSVATSGNHSLSPATNRLLYGTCELNGLTPGFAAQDQRGTATLVAGTATISALGVATSSRIKLLRQAAGGTLGHLSVGTITAGATFVINSSSATDTSIIAYEMEPA